MLTKMLINEKTNNKFFVNKIYGVRFYRIIIGSVPFFGGLLAFGRTNYYYDIKGARLIRHQTSGGREMMEPQRIK